MPAFAIPAVLVLLRQAKAGEIGFEPMNAASKGRCLTAWRLPNVLIYSDRLPAHRSPKGVGGATPQCFRYTLIGYDARLVKRSSLTENPENKKNRGGYNNYSLESPKKSIPASIPATLTFFPK